MLIWFVVLAPVLVAEVFRSPMIDYRMVIFGSMLPVGEVVFGGAKVLHTLLGAVAALTIVMLATQGRLLLRRRLLGVPIGLFVHLVLDGSWADQELFWWPAFGTGFGGAPVPETSRSLLVIIVFELVGAGVGFWAWRRYDLAEPANRKRFLATGQLDRSVLS